MRLYWLLLGFFGVLCVLLTFMIFKDAGWMDTPHTVSLAIAVACMAVAVSGVVTTAGQILQRLQQGPPSTAGAHARRPPVRDEPLP